MSDATAVSITVAVSVASLSEDINTELERLQYHTASTLILPAKRNIFIVLEKYTKSPSCDRLASPSRVYSGVNPGLPEIGSRPPLTLTRIRGLKMYGRKIYLKLVKNKLNSLFR